MTVRVLEPAQNAVSALIILALLLGVVATFSLPVAASDGIGRGSHSAGTFMSASDKLTIDSPVVSEADVAAGAILIAQLVATAEAGVNNIWICPIETGWTQVERVGQSSNVVQHIWWRHIEAPQDNFTNYTFQSRLGNCDVQTGEATSIAGGMTVYSGVDTDDPVGAVESSVSVTNQNGGIAPAIATQHPAGSRVVRYFGTNNAREITPSSSIRVYSVQAGDRSRTAAAFDSAMSSDGPVDAFSAAWGRPAAWAATTVVLQVPSTSTEPDDTTPPQTTVDSGAYVAGNWTNVPVNISLNAIDTGGSAVKEIVYRADGAHEIPPTTVPGSSASLSVATDGMTTITYAAHDNAGNAESEQTFVVRIDTTAPELDGTPTTPNEHGWFNSSVTIDWTCSDALSGIYGDCPSDSVINGEGAGLSASATVSDKAGNQTTASVTGIDIDWTPPTDDDRASAGLE